jgi:L-asparaginase II
MTFYRSAAKPFQALPLVEDGVQHALGLTSQELALCVASHNSEEKHVEVARSILRKAGLDESALRCGPHPPLREETASRLLRAGESFGAIHSNCSGKHAGMLALASHHKWSLDGYLDRTHPVQRRALAEISRWTELPAASVHLGIDGCGVPTFGVPLERMAFSFARFAKEASEGSDPARIVDAMVGNPFFVAGTGRLCTALMEQAGDRVFLKVGAEGVYCAGLRNRGMGIAVKVEDGAWRANDAAMVHALGQVGVLDEDDLRTLSRFQSPELRNTRGEVTGTVTAVFELERVS